MKHSNLKGTGVALITPFLPNKQVDTEALINLVDFTIKNGVEYLVVLGTTSESATLTFEEKKLVKETIKKANSGRVPMVLGIGGNNTLSVIEQIKQIEDLQDFEAILSVTPYYNKPSQEGLYQHFKALSEATSHPILLYNVPGRTGVNMTAETTLRLAHDFKNIIGIKEASGNINQIMQLVKGKPEDFLIISGDDATALPSVLMGGDGVISVIGQGLPKEYSSLIRLGLQGENQKAQYLQYQLLNVYDLIFKEGNPTGIKSLLSLRGIIKNELRLPLVKATSSLENSIEAFLKDLKVI